MLFALSVEIGLKNATTLTSWSNYRHYFLYHCTVNPQRMFFKEPVYTYSLSPWSHLGRTPLHRSKAVHKDTGDVKYINQINATYQITICCLKWVIHFLGMWKHMYMTHVEEQGKKVCKVTAVECYQCFSLILRNAKPNCTRSWQGRILLCQSQLFLSVI